MDTIEDFEKDLSNNLYKFYLILEWNRRPAVG